MLLHSWQGKKVVKFALEVSAAGIIHSAVWE